jgi:glycosyltransferase involved in cell wall biosynthesis
MIAPPIVAGNADGSTCENNLKSRTAVCLHMVGASSVIGGGGSNTFIRGLVFRQRALGWNPIIVINESANDHPPHSEKELGLTETNPFSIRSLPAVLGMDRRAYYSRRPLAAPGVAELFGELRPSVVHFHTLNHMAGPLHLEAAKGIGARTIVTYHTGGISCPQTGLLENGKVPCDGHLEEVRCTRCRFANRGMPVPLASLLAHLPLPRGANDDTSIVGRLLSSRAMTQAFIESFLSTLKWIDIIHIQSRWIRDVLIANGVPREKLAFVEMGVAQDSAEWANDLPISFDVARPLRLVFAGRCSDIKGIETLLEALKKLPGNAPVEVSLLGPGWDSPYGRRLLAPFAHDVRLLPPTVIDADVMLRELATHDACLVPSIWLETGPLAVYEAMAAGLPVIGSRLGGIAERIRDRVDGLLFAPGDSGQLADIISSLLNSPAQLLGLRRNIRPQRTFDDMARELDAFYRRM